MPDPVGAVLATCDALPTGVDVVVLGGLAANAYRLETRLTLDADLLLVVDVRLAGDIERKMLDAGFERPPGRRGYRAGRFVWRRLIWPRPDPINPTKVDLFFSGADEHSGAFIRSVAARAVSTSFGSRMVKVATPEDVIVFKALAIASGVRGTKAVTDQDDVWSILGNRRLKLDVVYIRSMASTVGVLRVVSRLMKRIGS